MRITSFTLQAAAGASYTRFRFPAADLEPSCALSLRTAGDMGYDPELPNPNRTGFFSSLGIAADAVFARKQTHSRDVALVSSSRVFGAACGDGLACGGDAFLSVTVADCLPVFLADRDSGAFALLHSGWKGTGIALEALSLMRRQWGTDPSRVSALLGPCIRGCCYEVGADRAGELLAEYPGLRAGGPLGFAVREQGKRRFIDLQAANAALLEKAGVGELAVCLNCTYTDDRLGSFRREGSDRFTRMAAVLGRLPEEHSR